MTLTAYFRRHVKVAAHPYEGLPVILACGIGRSGTTALRHGLDAHPDLHGTGDENNIVYDVLDVARHNCTYPSRRATMHVAPPAYDRQFRLLLLNLLWPKPRRGVKRPRALLASTDMTADRAEYALRVFPNVRFAVIVRNGIEVVASRMVHPNFRDTSFETHCRIWTAAAELDRWGTGRSAYATLRHEQLLDPDSARTAVATLLQALGLRPCPACAETVVGQKFHPTRAEGEAAEAAEDLRRRGERWRQWRDEERVAFERICGEAMQHFGYAVPW